MRVVWVILLEERRHMVVFQDRLVVVQIGQSRPGLDVKIICGSRVVEVMDYGGEKERKDLQVWQPGLSSKQS